MAKPFPALDLAPMKPATLSKPVTVTPTLYPAPKGYQSADLAHPCDPPAALGAFYPK